MHSRTFCLPDREGAVCLDQSVLDYMCRFAQRRFFHPESGGQLFSPAPDAMDVQITHATGPNPRDVRRRHAFIPDANEATADRTNQFAAGRHAVGLWHTHPETHPTPSERDHATACEFLDAFEGRMNGFLMVIVGNQGDPLNMAVWLARAQTISAWVRLDEVCPKKLEPVLKL